MADSNKDNRRNALVFVNKGTEDTDQLSGYYRDEALTEYLIAGIMTADRMEFRIIDKESQNVVGECVAKPRKTASTNEKAPIAFGKLTFNGESFGICVRPADLNDKVGYGVFPDKFTEQVSGRW